jgi:hypothetical protein
MTCTRNITAVFEKITCSLSVSITPDGGGEISLEPEESNHEYDLNTKVTIKAIPESGFKFSHWSGTASGSDNLLTIEMDSEKYITANFIKVPWIQSSWWWILIAVIVIGSLGYFFVIRRPGP